MDIKWIDELPDKSRTRGHKTSKYDTFAEELKDHPTRWAQWPSSSLKETTLRSLSSAINTKNDTAPRAFKTGKWEATVRQGMLYVRFLGAE